MRILFSLIAFCISLAANAQTAPATCRGSILEVSVVPDYTLTYVRRCLPAPHWMMMVTHADQSASVDSLTLKSEGVDVEKEIVSRFTNGISQLDADVIVNVVGQALEKGDLVVAKLALIDLIIGAYVVPGESTVERP